MRAENRSALAKIIRGLQVDESILTVNLPAASLSLYNTYNDDLFNEFISLLENVDIADAVVETALRQIVRMHGNVIRKSSLDYSFYPSLPMHAACLAVAHYIAQPLESVISILLPTVKRTVGIAPMGEASADGDYPLTTYVPNETFAFKDFLLSTSGDALIDIQSMFDYAKDNPDRLFALKEGGTDTSYFVIMPEDCFQLRKIASGASEAYYLAIEKLYQAKHNEKPSVGYALRQLRTALALSSKTKNGSESTANDIAYSAVRGFRKLWDALQAQWDAPKALEKAQWDELRLSEAEQAIELAALWSRTGEKIKDYTAPGATYSLESYLLCLFAHTDGVSQDKFERVEREGLVICTNLIGEQLETILKAHPDLETMPLPGYDAASLRDVVVPKTAELTALSSALAAALPERQIVGADEHLSSRLSIASTLLKYFFKPPLTDSIFDKLDKLKPQLTDLHHVTDALLLLPVQHWRSFFSCFDELVAGIMDKISRAMGERILVGRIHRTINRMHAAGFLDGDPFVFLLKAFPTENWPSLCGVILHPMYKRNTAKFFADSTHLGIALKALPKAQWPALKEAIPSDLMKTMLCAASDIVTIVDITTASHAEVFQVFSAQIRVILNSPREMAMLFGKTAMAYWSDLFSVYIPLMRREDSPVDLIAILKGFAFSRNLGFVGAGPADRAIIFLERWVDWCPDWRIVKRAVFFELLNQIDDEYWPRIFALLGPQFCSRFITTLEEFDQFLCTFVSIDSRKLCVEGLQPYVKITKDIKPVTLDRMLHVFPDCESAILRALKNQLPLVLRGLFRSLFMLGDYGQKQPPEMITSLSFLVDKALPILLDLEYLGLSMKTDELMKQPVVLQTLIENLCRIDNEVKKNHRVQHDGDYKKIQLLNDCVDYIKQSGTVFEPEEQALLTGFVNQIDERFGVDLLQDIKALQISRNENLFATDDLRGASSASTQLCSDDLTLELQGAKTARQVQDALRMASAARSRHSLLAARHGATAAAAAALPPQQVDPESDEDDVVVLDDGLFALEPV